MKIPKYIKDKIRLRAKYGELVMSLDYEIHEWMEHNGLENKYNQLIDMEHNKYLALNSIMLVTEPFALKQATIDYIEKYRKI